MEMTLPFTVQQHLFRAYDIRGARQYFTADFIQALGKAFAKLYLSQSHDSTNSNATPLHNATLINNNQPAYAQMHSAKAKTVVIGYDVRINSDTIAQTLADILSKNGLVVINLGLITTPMMAFWAQQYYGHGIMVTASHSTKDTLGIKWLIDNTSPSGLEIQALYQQLRIYNSSYHDLFNGRHNSLYHHLHNDRHNSDFINVNPTQSYYQKFYISQSKPSTQSGFLNINPLADNKIDLIDLPADIVAITYINAIAQVFLAIDSNSNLADLDNSHSSSKPAKATAKLDLIVVIDCMNGATSNIAQPLFERFCQRVIMLNDTPDGNFPTGNPDPTEPNRLAELQHTVIVNEADLGLAFDGDGDRLMIVDNSGKVVVPDHLLYLLAQVAITERPSTSDSSGTIDSLDKPHVLFDVKCSHHLPKLLSALGTTPIMTRTGSSLLRQQLQTHERNALFAGELSGHFIFNDGYFIAYDDAMYAGLRLLHWLTYTAPNLNILAPLTVNGITSTPIITDIWGEPRVHATPYQLTDITQTLPILISSADHYLSLNDKNDSSCTIIDHLIDFCHYLQRLADPNANDKASNYEVASFYEPLPYDCFGSKTPAVITKAEAQQLLPVGTKLSCIDGVRLDFAHGFGVLRKSNTSNSLTVRFAGDSVSDLKKVRASFVALCDLFDKDLAKQIATIYSE